ncbi:glycosyltransferase [Alkalicoccus daliensis]|uniref:Glycosyltransferase involved in cell wall bisynthesis n=1 Tax=Alkalicoccus daliensis TaxID=745820 RepID=A0A1G9ZM55_9BACI|nr:glycosyltransferase [Alkalicoccus daliensis]SDN22217.1 Glycosyltransferase involved in cell wall bisynthesis [Alkalicoccus daliensis]
MKKKLLFVIDSLACAGAEKSLVTLLNLINYEKYEVDLQLFNYGGELEELVPKQVNLLPPLQYMDHVKKNLWNSLISSPLTHSMARIQYSYKLRLKKSDNITKARLFWKSASKVISENPVLYDSAIAYAQGVPTFYVSEKVNALKKLAWVNVSYYLKGENKIFQEKHYNKFDAVVTVSGTTKDIFTQNKLNIKGDLKVIYDINNPKMISKMADNGEGFQDKYKGIKILTIGRLAKQKGYDIAMEACSRLKKGGLNFRWYVLGKGPLESEIKSRIKELNIEKEMILLGVKSNPYPFIKEADIYVQTSRFEGFGIALAEARMLNTPIVTTRFDAVESQMKHNENGIIVDIDPEAVYFGIKKLVEEPALREKIISYQKLEAKGNVEEINKFYELVET